MSEPEAEESHNDPNKRRNRKRPKNFLKDAKKYAKKGDWGRGTPISEELYLYFVGILDALRKGVEDDEQRQCLVNNALERTKGDELNIIGNQVGCRLVQVLLPFSSPEDLERHFEIIQPELRRLCSDKFSSHVVETVLKVASERATEHLQNEEDDPEDSDSDEAPKKKIKLAPKAKPKYSQEHLENCSEIVFKICKFALNNLEDFVWDTYANHIVRRAFRCLSGITLLPNEKPVINVFLLQKNDKLTPNPPTPFLKKMVFRTVPEEYKELAKEFVKRLSVWPQFKDLPYQNLTSGLLQVMVYGVKNVDKSLARDLLKQLLNESFAPDDWVSTGSDDKKEEKVDLENDINERTDQTGTLPPVFGSEPAVRLMESALLVAKKKMYTQYYVKCFINRLAHLSTVPMLNFTVQRLFDSCKIKEELEPMFDELANKFGDVLACGNTGVLVSVAKACQRVKARQAHFVTNLESALKCTGESQKYFAVLCLRMMTSDQLDPTSFDKSYYINIHGSVILQTILDFQRPAKAVTSLLELSPEELLVIFCDSKGSHVADAFCSGEFVGVKARDKMIWRLKGYYQKLALSCHGSRALERIFAAASLDQKIKIMAEISDKSNLLNGTKHGRIIAEKLDLETFKAAPKQWEKKWKDK